MYSDLFGEYERLLRVYVLGREFEVPENNTLLRCFQFAAPAKISYGQFCWNGTCNNCAVTVKHGERQTKELACRFEAHDGVEVTAVSCEIKRNLL